MSASRSVLHAWLRLMLAWHLNVVIRVGAPLAVMIVIYVLVVRMVCCRRSIIVARSCMGRVIAR